MTSGLAYIGDSHGILAACRDLIDAAESCIVLQMYLFAQNGDQTLLLPRPGAFPYAETVAGWLIEKKRQRPELPIVVLLDSNTPADPRLTRRRGTLIRQRLRAAGILVLSANLFHARFDRRRRLLPRMNFHLDHAHVPHEAWVDHQNRWQVLHNVEDHRKNLVIDYGRAGALTSHNFFDTAYDWHENLFWLTGEAAQALHRTATSALTAALTIPQDLRPDERAAIEALVAEPARTTAPLAPTLKGVPGYSFGLRVPVSSLNEDPSCALIENEEIRPRLAALFDGAGPGDELLVASAYFSDLEMFDAISRAVERGARARVLIDSIHALPLPHVYSWVTRSLVNHEVRVRAMELAARFTDRFELRVHDSRGGAMMHLKTAARVGRDPLLIGGQANFTPNSFSGAYLETDLVTRAAPVLAAFTDHFERLWSLPESRPLRHPPDAVERLRLRFLSLLLFLFGLLGLRP